MPFPVYLTLFNAIFMHYKKETLKLLRRFKASGNKPPLEAEAVILCTVILKIGHKSSLQFSQMAF